MKKALLARYRQLVSKLLSVAIATALFAPLAYAAHPACQLEAHVMPQHQSVSGGATVQLDASPSMKAEKYIWEQVGGPEVKLSSSSAANPSFKAPIAEAAGTAVVFLLTVSGCSEETAGITTTIHVNNASAAHQPATIVANADESDVESLKIAQ